MLTLSEKQIYLLAMGLMAALFIAALVRVWLLRRVEERLIKNKDALEKQVVLQQKDLMTVRQESNAWRTEMQRQFDLFRHMASDQLGVEERRFNDLFSQSKRREQEMQMALDVTRQMCGELPAAKARILHLESLLVAPAQREPAPLPASPAPAAAPAPVTPLPALTPDAAASVAAATKPAPAAIPAPAEPEPAAMESAPAVAETSSESASPEDNLAEAKKKTPPYSWL